MHRVELTASGQRHVYGSLLLLASILILDLSLVNSVSWEKDRMQVFIPDP
jgi:hypothetical protein